MNTNSFSSRVNAHTYVFVVQKFFYDHFIFIAVLANINKQYSYSSERFLDQLNENLFVWIPAMKMFLYLLSFHRYDVQMYSYSTKYSLILDLCPSSSQYLEAVFQNVISSSIISYQRS